MGKFANEALFYMFYNMPKENMQVPWVASDDVLLQS